jgi:hypothetical protein
MIAATMITTRIAPRRRMMFVLPGTFSVSWTAVAVIVSTAEVTEVVGVVCTQETSGAARAALAKATARPMVIRSMGRACFIMEMSSTQ